MEGSRESGGGERDLPRKSSARRGRRVEKLERWESRPIGTHRGMPVMPRALHIKVSIYLALVFSPWYPQFVGFPSLISFEPWLTALRKTTPL